MEAELDRAWRPSVSATLRTRAAWLLGAMRAAGPFPLLAVSGEQGSAKTFLSKLLRALIDPNAAPVRAMSREARELFIAANNAHILAFDNLSSLSHRPSPDTLCRLASGGSFAVRALFTDQDEILFSAARPVILNGIDDIITRPDLADRAIMLTLDAISESERRPEQFLWREFNLVRPRILGALLDAAVEGLRTKAQVRVRHMPRMADFAVWVAACETAYWTAGTFERAYWVNRQTAIEDVIEADPVAMCVRQLMSTRTAWAGTASDFLRMSAELLGQGMPGQHAAGVGWPKNPRALAGRLRRAQIILRALGIEISFSRVGRAGTRLIRMNAARSGPRGPIRRRTVSGTADDSKIASDKRLKWRANGRAPTVSDGADARTS